jgi:hypothetical protein
MIVFQAEHNILMHPFHMLGVAGVFGDFFGEGFVSVSSDYSAERLVDLKEKHEENLWSEE